RSLPHVQDAIYRDAPMTISHDAVRFSFTATGPWSVDPDQITWRVGIDELRAKTAKQGTALAHPPKLPPVIRLLSTGQSLGRAVAGWRLIDKRKGDSASRAGISKRLRKAFEKLGPTYIKLGQIVSAGE